MIPQAISSFSLNLFEETLSVIVWTAPRRCQYPAERPEVITLRFIDIRIRLRLLRVIEVNTSELSRSIRNCISRPMALSLL